MEKQIIGIIGLGRIGSGICINLTNKGYKVMGYDVNKVAYKNCMESQKTGLFYPVEKIEEIKTHANVIILSLPTGKEVLDITENLSDFKGIIIDTSTLSIEELHKILDVVLKNQLKYFTCRLERGPKEAREGTLALYCGGNRDEFDYLLDLLKDIGEPVYIGSHEQATMLKLISNMIGTVMVVLNGEISSVIKSANIDYETAIKALSMGGANNVQFFRLLWQLKNEYQDSFSLDLAQHVVELAIKSSKDYYGINSLPLTELANNIMVIAKSLGFGKKDVSEVAKLNDIINNISSQGK
ncbi:NAD(P)-dependent oxidoreductase [Acidianus manzaensis]|uniref:3-hydroxyisobutyrate dehydrogenase n=1 Tax=Acidianus manzaensis TaxID=282676 RepID=A0A1W6JWU4_9CREN|nr:NAD(P)-binding domain-containing protein [Acidianus manzaensis]ARM74725.1 hypothetical protein B6F84_00925 [Acidianus manzaensis]